MKPDNAINFLQSLAFRVVSLPRADLLPGQTLLRTNEKELTRLGDLSTIIDPGTVPFPPVSKDNVAGGSPRPTAAPPFLKLGRKSRSGSSRLDCCQVFIP